MIDSSTQLERSQAVALAAAAIVPALVRRLRAVGIVLLACDESGELLNAASAACDSHLRNGHGDDAALNNDNNNDDWLRKLFLNSALFRCLLKNAVCGGPGWSEQEEPLVTQLMPGLWLAPMPIVSRRRRIGYVIALIPCQELLHAEQLHALCQSASFDVNLCRSLLAKLPPVSQGDLPRLVSLIRLAYDHQVQLASSGEAVESIGRQLAESYEEISLLYTIIQNMTVQERPERFLALACEELLHTLRYAWIGAQLVSDHTRLKNLSGRLIIAGQPGLPAGELRAPARALLEQARSAHPLEGLVLEPGRNPKHAQFRALGSTIVAHPLCSQGEIIGVLIAGEKRGPDVTANNIDIKLLGATASHIAIFLENAALYDDLHAMFMGTLEALTASIDAKDRYTCGHSRRVAHLTQQLAIAVGLDEHTVNRVHIAGLVHDVGKIGVPETVLLKPGKLTPEEFEWIRKHPEMGYRILRDIPQLHDILPGVLHHHERWDGKGYPQGLAGEAIPLVARLISLADSFDAMSSTRTYRAAMSRKQVLAEISKCAGTQYDPDLAAAFVKLDFAQFDRLVREHQASEAPERILKSEKAA